MPSLPFVVAPKRQTRIVEASVNGEICSLEFPVYGSLLAGEEIAIREHEYQAVVYRESSRLADALVGDGINEAEAQRLAIRILSTRLGVPVPLDAREQRLMLHHATLVADLQNQISYAFQQQLIRTVTAAIANRLPGCSGWSDADTEKLPQPLQQAISAFIDDERNAGQPQRKPEELVDEMVDTLGKLGPEPEQSPPTGPASTGVAAGSGPVHQSSAVNASPGSPSPTSSMPSSTASAS